MRPIECIRILFGVVACAIVALLAHALMFRLQRSCGVGVTLALSGMAAWMGHTLRSAAYAEDFVGALRDVGLSLKEAAITMGCSFSQLSEGVSGTEMLSASRAAELPPAFHVAFARRLLRRHAPEVTVIESRHVADLVNRVDALVSRRFAPKKVEVA